MTKAKVEGAIRQAVADLVEGGSFRLVLTDSEVGHMAEVILEAEADGS